MTPPAPTIKASEERLPSREGEEIPLSLLAKYDLTAFPGSLRSVTLGPNFYLFSEGTVEGGTVNSALALRKAVAVPRAQGAFEVVA